MSIIKNRPDKITFIISRGNAWFIYILSRKSDYEKTRICFNISRTALLYLNKVFLIRRGNARCAIQRNYLDPLCRTQRWAASGIVSRCACSSVCRGQRVEAYRKARKLRYSEFPFREILRYPQSRCKSSRIGAKIRTTSSAFFRWKLKISRYRLCDNPTSPGRL